MDHIRGLLPEVARLSRARLRMLVRSFDFAAPFRFLLIFVLIQHYVLYMNLQFCQLLL